MPVVSVILTSFNQGEYLPDAIESVLGQTYRDFELIVIDNGSTDGSQDFLRRYQSHPQVRLILHSQNAAVSKRFNEGISLATGEYISFLYSDDYYLPTKLMHQVECFSKLSPDYGVVYGPTLGLNVLNGKEWQYKSLNCSGHILEDILLNYEKGFIQMLSPLTKRICFLDYPFLEDIFAEGEAIFYRIAMKYKFSYLDKAFVVMRDHGKNRGKAVKRNMEFVLKSLAEVEAHRDCPDHCRQYLNRHRAILFRHAGWNAVRMGVETAWARNCFAEAIKLVPLDLFHPRVLVGLALSFLPLVLLRKVNSVGNAIRRHSNNNTYVEDYGGSRSAASG